MHGLIAAAGLSSRLGDLSEKRNKVLLDLGGEPLLGTILTNFEHADIAPTFVTVGFDAPAIRTFCGTRATCLLNPFFEHYGILGSIWVARPLVEGAPLLFTTGDHYFALPRLQPKSRGDDPYPLGALVRHASYGVGRVTKLDGYGATRTVTIRFPAGEHKFRLSHVKLELIRPA